jgi:thiol:disulfide interchange protein DsbC
MSISKKLLGAGGAALVLVAGGIGTYVWANSDSSVMARIQKHFPNTKITAVDCGNPTKDWCEVVAGKNVFYTTRDAKKVMVGSLLDLEKKVDLTDQRLKALAALSQATAQIEGQAAPADQAALTKPVDQDVPPLAGNEGPPVGEKVSITLPKANAIVHNPGAPIKISVFSDYNCGFCRKLYDTLIAQAEFEVTEYPIAILGPDSETKAKLVMCSHDREAAAAAAYAGGTIRTGGDCGKTDGIVSQNTEFARAHGIQSTPTIIRHDGTSQAGFASLDSLKKFATGA